MKTWKQINKDLAFSDILHEGTAERQHLCATPSASCRHVMSDCAAEVVCHRCQQSGHVSASCPNNNLCYKCGLPGHLAMGCTASPAVCSYPLASFSVVILYISSVGSEKQIALAPSFTSSWFFPGCHLTIVAIHAFLARRLLPLSGDRECVPQLQNARSFCVGMPLGSCVQQLPDGGTPGARLHCHQSLQQLWPARAPGQELHWTGGCVSRVHLSQLRDARSLCP